MDAACFLIKEALAKVDIDLEHAVRLAKERQKRLGRQMKQFRKLESIGHTARTHPAWHAAMTGGIGAATGAIPGILLGGWKGGLIGAGVGSALGGMFGMGRGERAREELKAIRRGALLGGDEPTDIMRRLAGGMSRA
jgi:hypothetical protein